MSKSDRIPRDKNNDHTREMASQRAAFIQAMTGRTMDTVSSYTIDPAVTNGNIENFIGTAQMPIGIAGPLLMDGEHAKGNFYIPLATTEGTLVASYSRGMRVISECGGARTTVVKQSMQRAPVFLFDNAMEAREFGKWLEEHIDAIRGVVKASVDVPRLIEIEKYIVAKMLYTRFCYTTGDAAGQNMTGKATLYACEWIRAHHPAKPRYILSGNIDTDKKHSSMNMIQTRGKRVVAEFVLKKEVAKELLRIEPEWLYRFRQIAGIGTHLSGAVYSGAHSANGIAAMFIATGQDAANVSESHAGMTYFELLDNGDLYSSVTLPALICATYGGGTGLPTQRECLEMMDCYGNGKVNKFAEIIAAVVLAGDLSLSSAILAHEWVSSHEKMGRNR
ncbi:MAG: hydroxymethylglutaryl-CoA reductase [Gammaproteobacteria bacterium]|nr:hydroxymethylglutaryl-CoA reductase [Gammaproteobacteria bacterium]